MAYDPYARLNLAEQVARDADAAIQATSRAEQVLGEQTTYRTTQLAAEVYATAAALEHQATAVSIEQTQQAPALFLQSTQVAIYEQATAAAITQTAQAPAVAAYVSAIEKEQYRAEGSKVWHAIWPWATAGAILFIGIATAFFVADLGESMKKWTAWRIQREKLENSYKDGLFGPVAVEWPDFPQWQILAPSDKYKALPRPQSQEVRWTPNKTTAIGPVRQVTDDMTEEVLQFLELAEKKTSQDSTVVPGWRELGLSPSKWRRLTRPLKVAGVVRSKDGVGTYVTEEAGSIGMIRYNLETGRLHLTPLPREGVSFGD